MLNLGLLRIPFKVTFVHFLFGNPHPIPRLKFNLKVTPAQVSSEGKLNGPQIGDLVQYKLDVQRSDSTKRGNFEVKVKDVLEGSGSFESTNRKGTGTTTVKLPGVQREVKADSTFDLAAPAYNWKLDVFYDHSKDAAKKITLATQNQVTGELIDSTSSLQVLDDVYTVAAKVINKPHQYSAETSLTLPTKRQLAAGADLRTSAAETATRSFTAHLCDTLADGKTKREVRLERTFTALEPKTGGLFEASEKLNYAGFGGKTLSAHSDYYHKQAGKYRAFGARTTVDGSVMPQPLTVDVAVDEYCPNHAVFHATAKLEEVADAELTGNYHVGSRDAGKPWTYDLKASASADVAGEQKRMSAATSGKVVVPKATVADGEQQQQQLEVEQKFELIAPSGKKAAVELHAKGTMRRGSASAKLTVPDQARPISVHTTYGVERTGDAEGGDAAVAADASVELQYGVDRTVKVAGDWKHTANKQIQAHVTIQTPFPEARNIELTAKAARSADGGKAVDGSATAVIDGRRYQHTARVVFAGDRPSVELTLQRPDDKLPMSLAYGYQRLGADKYSGRVQLANVGRYSLEASAEAGLAGGTWDTVYAVGDYSAAATRPQRVHAELRTKAGKQLDVLVTADGKNVVSGQAEYTVQQKSDAPGTVELVGSGSVKIYEQQKQATFVLRRSGPEANGGLSLVFNANVGGVEKVNANVVLAAQHFHVAVAICEENNKCTKLEVKSILNGPTLQAPAAYDHELFVLVDLLELGFDKEFQLQSQTSRDTAAGYKHELEMRLRTKDQSQQVVYHVLVGAGKALAELRLPKRTLAIEAVYRIPKPADLPFGRYEYSISSWPDRANAPAKTAQLTFSTDVQRPSADGVVQTAAELKLTHPLVRALSVRAQAAVPGRVADALAGGAQKAGAKLELDVFRLPAQAIVLEANFERTLDLNTRSTNASYVVSARSAGLDIDAGAQGHAAASLDRRQASAAFAAHCGADSRFAASTLAADDRVEASVRLNDDELFRIDGVLKQATDAQLTATVQAPGSTKPLRANVQTKGWRSVTAQVARPGVFSADAELTWAKIALVQLTDGAGKELARAQVALDAAHLLATEVRLADKAAVQKFAEQVRAKAAAESELVAGVLKERAQKQRARAEQMVKTLQAAVPDVAAAQKAYEEEVKKLGEELLADKSLKEAYDYL